MPCQKSFFNDKTLPLFSGKKEFAMALASDKTLIHQMVNAKINLENTTLVSGIKLILILFGSILLAVSAQYKVPLGPVPITLQSMVVMLIAIVYGWKLGGTTIVAYWLEGIFVGGIFSFLPWFANGSGLAYFLGAPSAGFLWGFLPMVIVVGYLVNNLSWYKNIFTLVSALLVGQLFLYFIGLAHAYLFVLPVVDWMVTPTEMLSIYLYPFIIGDILKTIIAALITIYFTKSLRRHM